MKCCHCIPLHVGAIIVGIFGLLICAVELSVLVPYMLNFNPDISQKNLLNIQNFGLNINDRSGRSLVPCEKFVPHQRVKRGYVRIGEKWVYEGSEEYDESEYYEDYGTDMHNDNYGESGTMAIDPTKQTNKRDLIKATGSDYDDDDSYEGSSAILTDPTKQMNNRDLIEASDHENYEGSGTSPILVDPTKQANKMDDIESSGSDNDDGSYEDFDDYYIKSPIRYFQPKLPDYSKTLDKKIFTNSEVNHSKENIPELTNSGNNISEVSYFGANSTVYNTAGINISENPRKNISKENINGPSGIKNFNPIQDAIQGFESFLIAHYKEGEILDFNITLNFINTYQENYIWPSCIGLITQACIFAICCILLMIGVYFNKTIMIPYMIFSIFRFFVYFGFGTAISVGFYYIQGKMFFGVAAVIFLFLLMFGLKTIYFWLTIRKAYRYHEIYNLQNSKIMSKVLHRYTSHASQTSGQIGKGIFHFYVFNR